MSQPVVFPGWRLEWFNLDAHGAHDISRIAPSLGQSCHAEIGELPMWGWGEAKNQNIQLHYLKLFETRYHGL